MSYDIFTRDHGVIQHSVQDFCSFQGDPVNILALRNITLEPLEVYLNYFAAASGLKARITWGGYDQLVQETVAGKGESPLHDLTLDAVIVFFRLEGAAWSLARNFMALGPETVKAEEKRLQDIITQMLRGIRKKTKAMILWFAFETPLYPVAGVLEGQGQDLQVATITRLNRFIAGELQAIPNAFFVDMDRLRARVGAAAFYDHRYWHIGRAPYNRDGYLEIALETMKFLRALKGKNKKCLVLDCDNVLWGGIIGEDGLEKISLGKTYPGSMYYEFQQEILNLYHRGILIALCSKNNPEDVWEVFRKHPDMLLKEEHIAAAQINWEDKTTNLPRIAQELNLGLDSFVFVDDAAFEINLVRSLLPEVTCLHLPVEQAPDYRDLLTSTGLFETLTFSWEDQKRGELYRAEEQRKKSAAQIADVETYLRSLEMEIEVKEADAFAMPRIAQLTQKTNQFNLTTRRYSESDIMLFMQDQGARVYYLRLKDRFGDMGIVGVAIVKGLQSGEADIDTFLMSCRALGRKVEEVFLSVVLRALRMEQIKRVIAEFLPTAKNVQVKDFYDRQGFSILKDSGKTGQKYQLELSRFKEKMHDHIHIRMGEDKK